MVMMMTVNITYAFALFSQVTTSLKAKTSSSMFFGILHKAALYGQ